MKTPLIISILFIISCQRKDNLDNSNLFNPPTEIKTADLQKAGYNYVDQWSWYNKISGDTAFIYQTHFDNDPIFSRLVDISNWTIQDSVGIKQFVESKDAALVTSLIKDNKGTYFFVQGKSSGQFFRCSLTSNHLTIEFHYPDSGDNLRSKYRKPTAGGFTVEFEKGQDKRSHKTR